MGTHPLRREGGYWKPVLDYEHWEEAPASGGQSDAVSVGNAVPEQPVRHDLCQNCGAEFVVDSPFCRMCGRARDAAAATTTSKWHVLEFYHLRHGLGLSVGAMVCFIAGLMCVAAAIITGFMYTASTLADWQAIQVWRGEWLLAAGVAFVCGILLNGGKTDN
jgi:hypothetical protein